MPARQRIRTRLTRPRVDRLAGESLSVVYVEISKLKRPSRRIRRRLSRQIEHVTASLKRFGFAIPLAISKDFVIVHGELLLEAAMALGLTRVPTVCLADLSPNEARAIRIAFHKIESLSEWDEDGLKAELEFIAAHDFELLSFMGFDSAELDFQLNTPTEEAASVIDDEQLCLPETIVSVLGDIWVFKGGHKLACGNALNSTSYQALMGDDQAGITRCDTPYNVPIEGHVTRRRCAREFAMASGEMNSDAFITFLRTIFEHCAAHSRNGSLSLQFMDWRHMNEMMAAGQAVYGELFQLAVWAKTNPGMGAPWQSAHELCFVWKKGGGPHVDNVQLGRNGRNRSDVWNYPGANQHRDPGSEGHVTPKNLVMIQDNILDVSNRGDIVLDACAGSATTLVAAHLADRRGYGRLPDHYVLQDLGDVGLDKILDPPVAYERNDVSVKAIRSVWR